MSATSPIGIGTLQTEIRDDGGACAAQFAQGRAMLCRSAVAPGFLGRLLALCNGGHFVSDAVEGLGHREVEKPGRAGGALTLALKRAAMTRWLETVTACGPLADVDGRIVQTWPRPDDQLVWHDDLTERRRRLAITVNLSEEPYEGGLFELRDVRRGTVLFQHRHDAPGDVLIFEVMRGLEHRVLPLTSGGPRRVYTGWFFSGSGS